MKVKSAIQNTLALLIIIFLSSYTFTACSTTPVPPVTNATSGPTLTWKVFNAATGVVQTYTGDALIKSPQGSDYTVTLLADDPGGVHQITLSSNSEWQCRSGNVAKNVGGSLGNKEDTQNLNPDSNGKVLTSIVLTRSITNGPYDCPNGYTFNGGGLRLVGTGTNFSKQKTQSVLGFTV